MKQIEIEAKLSLDKKDQAVFPKIYADFQKGSVSGFQIDPNSPEIVSDDRFNQYFEVDGQYVRVSRKDGQTTVTSKGQTEVIKDSFGLNCIVKRVETEDHQPSKIPPGAAVQTLRRQRQEFRIENLKNGRKYGVLIDLVSSGGEELNQIEIEGLANSIDEERIVAEDVSSITNYLVKKYPALKPTTLSKLEWLKSVAQEKSKL